MQQDYIVRYIYCRSGNIRKVLIFSRISREGQFRDFKNLASIIIIIAQLKKNENLNTQKLADFGQAYIFRPRSPLWH